MFFILIAIFGQYDDYRHGESIWNESQELSFTIFHRTSFALGLAILVLMCLLGYGGVVSYLLSARIWSPFAKLTYGIYLLHPMIIALYYASSANFLYFRNITVFYLFFSNCLIASFSALLLYVFVEKPFANLEHHFFVARFKGQA